MAKQKDNGNIKLLLGFVIAALIAVSALYLTGSDNNVKQTGSTYIDNKQTGQGSTLPPTSVAPTRNLFGDDGKGIYRPAIYNSMNTTETEYLSAAMRVYKVVNGAEVFYGTVTTNTSGMQSSGAGTLAIEGYDNNGNIQNYVAYVPAADATITSARYTFAAAEDVAVEYPVAQQQGLVFKVYDSENRAFTLSTSTVAAGTSETSSNVTNHNTGNIFNSTTSASAGYAVGVGGFIDYQIYMETNGTVATDTQFEDQVVLIGVDEGDLSDWDEPALSMNGAVITKLAPGQYNDKIKNLGYDYVYSITSNGKPLHTTSTYNKLNIQVNAKASVNPTDSIKVGFFTGGYFKQTTGSNMLLSTHKDDSSQTNVFTVQDLTLSIT